MFLKVVRQRSLRSKFATPESVAGNASSFAAEDVEVERRTGVSVGLPCTARNNGSHTDCHVFEELSFWNRCLWHVGLQLRELAGPGELSLVRVRDQGCGHEQEARSRDARLLFHALLTRHRCVVSLELDESIIEGAELRECRDLVVEAFRQNSTLRKLSLGVFRDYDFIRQELFAAVATKTSLMTLEFVGSGEFPSLVNPLRTLLVDVAANVSSLSIPGIRFDEEHARLLVAALERNDTLLALSLHVSILCSLLTDGQARFSLYVANCDRLHSLTRPDAVDRTKAAYDEVSSIVDALLPRGTILRLKLRGFLLDEDCANLLAALVARNGSLESLDLAGCQWIRNAAPSPDSTAPLNHEDLELKDQVPAFSSSVRSWIHAYNVNTNLTFLAIGLGGLTAEDRGGFLQVLATAEYLRTVFVSGVAAEDLPQVGSFIRDTGMCDKVFLRDEYLVSPALLCSLEECPEVLRHVVLSFASAPSADVCRETLLHLMTSRWCKVTTLRLFLSQEVLDQVTVEAMCLYLNETTALTELELDGYKEPDLSLLTGAESLNPLLRSLFHTSVRTLRIGGFRLGEANLRFLAEAVITNRTLCEFSFASCDSAENVSLLRFLALGFAENETMLHLHVSGSMTVETQVSRSLIQDVLGRNMGFVTCAAYSVVSGTRTARCVDALERVSESAALIDKVQKMASVDEAEATAMIQSVLAVT